VLWWNSIVCMLWQIFCCHHMLWGCSDDVARSLRLVGQLTQVVEAQRACIAALFCTLTYSCQSVSSCFNLFSLKKHPRGG
jgi:hypothetical protein